MRRRFERVRRRCPIDAESTLSLVAELALGLAGFGGVAAAFGGRDRQFSRGERTRLLALYVHSTLALVGALLTMALLWFEMALATACFWASLAGLVGQVPAAVHFTRRAWRFLQDAEMSTGPWAFLLTAMPTWMAATMFAAGLIGGPS